MKTIFGVLAILVFAGGILPFSWLIIFQNSGNNFSYFQIVIAMLASPWLYKKGALLGSVLAAAEPNAPMFNMKAVIRDVGILLLLAFSAGFLLGLTTFKISDYLFAGLSASISITGFVISGLLSLSLPKISRLRHMFAVLIIVWLTTLPTYINPPNFNLITWFLTLVSSSIYMLIGWRLSLLITTKN